MIILFAFMMIYELKNTFLFSNIIERINSSLLILNMASFSSIANDDSKK